MKKLIPVLITAAIFAGCTNAAAAQSDINAQSPEETEQPEITISETTVSETSSVLSEKTAESSAVTTSVTTAETTVSEEATVSEAETAEETAPAETESESETTVVTYQYGSPRYVDKDAVKDVVMSEERQYIYTDDKGEGRCGPLEGIFYATIPVSDDMPERIEFIDISTDIHVGYMYDDGDVQTSGDGTAGDGVYTIKLVYDFNIDKDPDVSDSWTQCYFGLYTDSQGVNHTCELPTFVNVIEPLTQKEKDGWDIVMDRINAITSSEAYESASVDEKEKMLLDELDKLADEGLVYRDLTRTNSNPRNVVFKIYKGPTMVIELEECACGYDPYDLTKSPYYDQLG